MGVLDYLLRVRLLVLARPARALPRLPAPPARPFTTGTWSSSLLDRPTTEYLCPAGHGSLSVSDMDVSGAHSAEWTDMDDAWRDLFAAGD